MPKVSVVMAVFNGERYVEQAIRSVLAQQSVDLELIVVNDGSTDRTRELIESCANTDARVRAINRQNSGRPAFPRNDGIAAARGEYVCFLDHDDLYDENRTRQLVNSLDANPDWVAVFSDMRWIDSEGALLPGTYLTEAHFMQRAAQYLTPKADGWFECSTTFFIFQSLVTGALHTSTALIAPRRLPAGTLAFDTQFILGEDVDLWIRLGLEGKMGYLNRALTSYRVHPTSIMNNAEKLEIDTARLHKHNFARIKDRLTSAQVRQLRRRIAGCVRSVAYINEKKFLLDEARAGYRESLAWSPSREAAVGFLKSFIPKELLKRLKNLAG